MRPENVYVLGQEECPIREGAEFPMVAATGGRSLTGLDTIVLVALVGGIGAAALWYFDVI